MTRLSEIRARLDALREVDWFLDPDTMCVLANDARCTIIHEPPGAPSNPSIAADSAIIAHAPADLRWLVGRVEALEKALGTAIGALRGLAVGKALESPDA